jgi:hypothetical protein
MVNRHEQPPLPPQPQILSPSSDSDHPGLTGKLRDWDLLPAPEPWKSIQKAGHGAIWFGCALLWTMGGLMLALALGGNLLIILVLPITLFIGGLALPIIGYSYSTDGIENWEIYLWRNPDLCEAMEPAFDRMLAQKGYRFLRGQFYSVYKNGTTLNPLGRNYIIRTVPGPPTVLPKLFAPKADDIDVILDFAFRPGSKYVSPYLTIELRNIRVQNYKFVLELQKEVVNTLESLNYLSYKKPG